MKRKIVGIVSACLIEISAISMAAGTQTKEEKTYNVVFILADDMGWNQVGYNGTTYYETPNIDKLAHHGIIFNNAYSANPVCSPTRASIMTGKNPARLHITDYISGDPFPYALLIRPEMLPGLPLEEETIGELFKSNGYVTGLFGKWHLNIDKNYKPGRPKDPGSQGFDDVFATVKPERDADPTNDAHHAVAITDHAINFIEKNKDKPFFAYVAHHVVHRPIMEKPALIDKYEAKDPSGDLVNNPIMGAMIETMDSGIGRILKKLDELGLTDKTIVVFYSDNGGYEMLQSQYPYRGGKAMVFEGGIRVPLAIKWPGKVKPGSTCNDFAISDDFFATFADILNEKKVPENLDGISLLPAILGKAKLNRDTLYWHYPHYHHQGYLPAGAIRVGDYKLIEWYEGSIGGKGNPYSLYNLVNDVGEMHDLAAQYPEKVKEMAAALKKWRKRIGSGEMSVNTKNYLPERANWRFIDGTPDDKY